VASNNDDYREAVAFTLPAISTILDMSSKASDQQKCFWLSYWLIFNLFNVLESIFAGSIPFYFWLKMAFLIWCCHPKTKGAELIYRSLSENVTDYSRPRLPQGKMCSSEPYLPWQEYIDPTEKKMIEEVIQSMNSQIKDLPRNSDPIAEARARCPFSYSDHMGLRCSVKGSLEIVDEQLEDLHDDLRVGLFEKAGSYDVLAAFSTVGCAGVSPSAAPGSRVSVKIKFTEEQTIDFTVCNVHDPEIVENRVPFFLNDAYDLALTQNLTVPNVIYNARQLFRVKSDLNKLLRIYDKFWDEDIAPLGRFYGTKTVYRCGKGAVQYFLRPLQNHKFLIDVNKKKDLSTVGKHQHDAIWKWFDEGKDAKFELCLQVATPKGAGRDPIAVMDHKKTDLIMLAHLVNTQSMFPQTNH